MIFRRVSGEADEELVSQRPDGRLHWSPVVVKTPAIFVLVIWAWRIGAALVKTVIRHPIACGLVVVLGGYWYVVGWQGALIWYGCMAAWLVVFWLLHRRGFMRLIGWPFLSWLRWMWIYRRRWRGTLTVAGLAARVQGRAYVPELVGVRSDAYADRVTVKMLRGQSDELWAERSRHLAHAFGSSACQVRVRKPGLLALALRRVDPLAAVVGLRPVSLVPSVGPVEIGLDEHGNVFRLALHGAHWLIAGATGAGKGSWLWLIVRGLLAGVEAGLVELHALDPKRMELSFGRGLFARYASKPEQCADLLEWLVERMQERADRYAGVRRNHVATVDEPMVVILADEIAYLTAYWPDRDVRKRVLAALATLCTQGRSVGFVVVAALQDPRADILSIRELFPMRVCLRVKTAAQVDMVLGDGMRDAGALADKIPYHPHNPSMSGGIGYVVDESGGEPLRVRAAWVSDDEIKELEAAWGVETDDGPPPDLPDLPDVPGLPEPGDVKVAGWRQAEISPPPSWGDGGQSDDDHDHGGGRRKNGRREGKRGKHSKGGKRRINGGGER
ncbi:FtsK/SpoIIIE domain-containing protein [Nonomuraea endophytica]|uniref:FtsK/SpoIIIE domain-containing protein n=1 Tax=Nonomuraea endophytica TaxID=714136 RepID=UPI0037C9850B